MLNTQEIKRPIDVLVDIQAVPLFADGIATVLRGLLPPLLTIDSNHNYFIIGNSDSFSSFCPKLPNVQGEVWLKSSNAKFRRVTKQYLFDRRRINFLSPQIFFSPSTLLPHRLSTKVVAIPLIHDLAIYKVNNIYTKIRTLYHKFLFNNVIHRANHLVTISEATKRDLQEIFDIQGSKITVIPHGTPIDVYSGCIDEIAVHRQRLNLPERYILFVGKIQPRKNIARLIQAFDILAQRPDEKDVFLIIAGRFAWMTEEVKTAYNLATYKNRICFVGEISDKDLAWLYRCATIFSYVSLYEGFGLPILEAMASGAAVVTSNFGAMAEVAGNAALLVNPFDIEEIAHTLEKVLRDQYVQRDLIVKGFNQVKKYTWESSAKEYVTLWDKLLN